MKDGRDAKAKQAWSCVATFARTKQDCKGRQASIKQGTFNCTWKGTLLKNHKHWQRLYPMYPVWCEEQRRWVMYVRQMVEGGAGTITLRGRLFQAPFIFMMLWVYFYVEDETKQETNLPENKQKDISPKCFLHVFLPCAFTTATTIVPSHQLWHSSSHPPLLPSHASYP